MKFEVLKRSYLKRNIIIGVLGVAIISTVVLNFTRAKYRVTESIPLVNRTINDTPYDFKVIAMYQENDNGEYTSVDVMPSGGYVINEEKSYCTLDGKTKDENAILKTIDGNHTIANLSKKSKCYLYFDELAGLTIDEILANIENGKYIVTNVKLGEKKRTPAPPFTTSTMQQEASRKLGFSLKKTMSVAQGLYEGVKIPEKGTVGLITYMRTDSTRISEEARAAAKEEITKTYGNAYYENRYYKKSSEAQDAHEAIRPTYINISPESIRTSLTLDQYRLYKLIYNRFLASQMASAVFDTINVDIDVNKYNFKASGQNLKFKGFMVLYVEGNDSNENDDENVMLPMLEAGQEVKKKKLNPKQSFTEPPARYTEASLVKELEAKGIGRPSTYSPIITTIIERRYVEKEKKQLVPTELGGVVNKLLIENFSDVVNVEFTAKVENEFDDVASGKEEWKQVLRDFYPQFEQEVEKVDKELEHVKLEDEVTDVKCEKCGRNMVVKIGRYGKFLACPGYPECKNVKPFVVTIDVPCPVCGGKAQIRKSKRGKSYYICENNPKSCNYISWNKPKVGENWTPEEIKPEKKTTRKKTTKTTTKKTRKRNQSE